jgi:type VI secretion system secreted protein VgrG
MNEHASLQIDRKEYEVVALTGEEGLSRLFRYEVVCATDVGADDTHGLIGRNATITLRAWDAERTVRGIVTGARQRFDDHGGAELVLTVRPPAYRLSLGRQSRCFHLVDVSGIVRKVLGPLPHRWELTDSYEQREYAAQYREDDWTFVSRLCEDEGIYYRFDHEDGSVLVLGDGSPSAPEIVGGAPIAFSYDTGLSLQREVVYELASEVSAVPDTFTIGSFDPGHPALTLRAAAGSGRLEHYDAPGAGPRTPEACAHRARVLREGAIAAQHVVGGATSSIRLEPGRILALAGHPIGRYDRRWLVTEVHVEIVQRRRGNTGENLVSRFRAVPDDIRFRPLHVTPRAKQVGLQSGAVVGAVGEEIHPDDEGRVRVQLHWDREGQRDDKSGRWMRVAQRGTADSMLLPRIGWNVLTFNEEGAVDDPSVLSRIHDAEHPPAYALPGNMTRVVFKTATSPGGGSHNEVYFEDQKGAEEMFINASKDMGVLVLNQKADQVANNVTRNVAVDHDFAVTADSGQDVGADQTITVGGNETLTVLGARSKQIGGNESETIGASRKIDTGAAHTIQVTGDRSLKVGASSIEATLGPVSSSSGKTTKILVGGAAVRATVKDMSESVMLGSIQTVGGAKLEIAGDGRSIKSKFLLTETVGGVMVLKTNGDFGATTKMAQAYAVGGPLMCTAPTLEVTAATKIVLKSGASSITITPSNIELAAPKFDLGSDLLTALGTRIDHN